MYKSETVDPSVFLTRSIYKFPRKSETRYKFKVPKIQRNAENLIALHILQNIIFFIGSSKGIGQNLDIGRTVSCKLLSTKAPQHINRCPSQVIGHQLFLVSLEFRTQIFRTRRQN